MVTAIGVFLYHLATQLGCGLLIDFHEIIIIIMVWYKNNCLEFCCVPYHQLHIGIYCSDFVHFVGVGGCGWWWCACLLPILWKMFKWFWCNFQAWSHKIQRIIGKMHAAAQVAIGIQDRQTGRRTALRPTDRQTDREKRTQRQTQTQSCRNGAKGIDNDSLNHTTFGVSPLP